jgi:hypothetical protein
VTSGATQRLPPVLKFPGGPLSRTDQRARRHVSKVAVVDVFCAFRMLLCVGTVCCPERASVRSSTYVLLFKRELSSGECRTIPRTCHFRPCCIAYK